MTLRPFPELTPPDAFDLMVEADAYQASWSDYLSASAGEAWWSSLPGQFAARLRAPDVLPDDGQLEIRARVSGVPVEQIRANMARAEQPVALSPLMTEEEYRASPWQRDGLDWDPRMTQARAQARAEIADENALRRQVLANPADGWQAAAGLVTQIGVGLTDPVNYIPVFGPAARAAAAARFGRVAGTAVVQAADAAVSTAAIQPLLLPSRREFGDDVGFADAAMDVGFSALFGAAFGAGAGAWAKWRGDPVAHDVPVQRTAADTLSAAADDVARGDTPTLHDRMDRLSQEVDRLRSAVPQVDETYTWSQGDPWPDDILTARDAARQIPETIGIDTPERQALRLDITDRLYGSGARQKDRQAFIFLGLPASGKSTLSDPAAEKFGALIIDSDEAKKLIPEFQGGIGANAVHEESDAILQNVLDRAKDEGDNLVLPLVGRTYGSLAERIEILHRFGYQIHLYMVDLPAEKAVTRNILRYRETGRFIDPDYLLSVGNGPARNFDTLKHHVDSYARYDNDVPRGSPPRLIERGGRSGPDGGPGPAGGPPGGEPPRPGPDHRPLSTGGTQAGGGTLEGRGAASAASSESAAGATGALDTVTTPGGRRVAVRYEVVDAAALVTSHGDDLSANALYPADLQPRDRSRASSAEQVAAIAANPIPDLLGRSGSAADGAPVVGPDGVVESGNGRVLGLRRAYQANPDGAARYRDWLTQQGYDVSGLTAPVLVRRRVDDLSPADRAAFAREANDRTTLAMGATERAMADAASLSDGLFAYWRGGEVTADANREFVRRWMATLPQSERGSLIDADGGLSRDGLARLRTALLARAYDAPDLVALLAESLDNNIRAIGQALTELAPDWIRLRARVRAGEVMADMDQTAALMEAVGLIRRARDSGVKVRDIVSQMDLFAPRAGEVTAFLRLMYGDDLGKAVSQKQLLMDLGRYVDQAGQNLAGPRLFGQPLAAVEVLGTVSRTATPRMDPTPARTDPLPDVAALTVQARQPGDVDRWASDLGIDLKTGEIPEAARIRQMEAEGTLHPDEVAEIRAAEALMQKADNYADAYEAAAVCMGSRG